MKKNIIILIFLSIFLGVTSCSNWLDVKPKKTVEEEELFSREIGFKEALTAAYIKMANTNLYAKNLSYGFIDVLGQRYENGTGTDSYQDELYYTFPSKLTEDYTTTIWNKMYNVIADLNNLLYWVDKNKYVFTTENYYEIIKGEALGLRAFLHFDLLRMYGPIYKEQPAAKSICYRSTFSREVTELLPANVVVDSIVLDLKHAESLLADTDPLLFDFPQDELEEDYEMSGDRFLVYRHKRMNLYAVKAMLARVYMYAQDKDNAVKYAKEVVDSKVFNLVSDNSVDRIFSTEIIFSIYVDKFVDQVATDFGKNSKWSISDRQFLNELFDVANDGSNDIRMREGVGFDYDTFSAMTRKYKQDNMWVSTEGTIPLIRLPEMYYILAECESNDDVSADYLNKVREARGIDGTSYKNSASKKLTEIEKEYRKEFYGEGQLFFFYKRHFYTTFLHCPVSLLVEKNYIFNLPENEQLFGKTN